jgi:hypothetical protein
MDDYSSLARRGVSSLLHNHFACGPEDRVSTAVIFDIDGTLADFVDLQAEAWAVTFAKYGKQMVFSVGVERRGVTLSGLRGDLP